MGPSWPTSGVDDLLTLIFHKKVLLSVAQQVGSEQWVTMNPGMHCGSIMYIDSFKASASFNSLNSSVHLLLFSSISQVAFSRRNFFFKEKEIQEKFKKRAYYYSSSRLLQITSLRLKQAYPFLLLHWKYLRGPLYGPIFSFPWMKWWDWYRLLSIFEWNGDIDLHFKVFLWGLNEITLESSKYSVWLRVCPFHT